MTTLADDLISAVSKLRPRLSHRHAEKLIPPTELKQIQTFWSDATSSDRIKILHSFDNMQEKELKQFFQLMSRQGISSLIAMRESQIRSKEQFSGSLKDTLTEVLQNSLDSSLEISQITFASSQVLLNKFKTSDRVHKISSEDSFTRRLASDRRVFYFSHTKNPLQPLIVVNIALAHAISDNISEILHGSSIESEDNFNAAIFYSISAMESGLRGIDLGHRLIVTACEEMANNCATERLSQWSSLSPVPQFRAFLEKLIAEDPERILKVIPRQDMNSFVELVHSKNAQLLPKFSETLPLLLCDYLLNGKKSDGSVLCAVQNFHVRNGAVLWRINFGANVSDYGMAESLSMMVNYRYYQDQMWANALKYQEDFTITTSELVSAMKV